MQSDTQVYQVVIQQSLPSQQNPNNYNLGTKVEPASSWPVLAILPLQICMISIP